MTAEEQIYAYKELKKNCQAFFVYTYENANKIIYALEKQIPKKPINGCCPDCGILLKKFAPYTYCAKCGRKLDAPWCME